MWASGRSVSSSRRAGNSGSAANETPVRPLVRWLAAGIMIAFGLLLGAAAVEVVARVEWHRKYIAWLVPQLHGFDHIDEARELIVPNPNTVITVGAFRRLMAAQGKTLGLQIFDSSSAGRTNADTVVLFRINHLGFKVRRSPSRSRME